MPEESLVKVYNVISESLVADLSDQCIKVKHINLNMKESES